MVRTSISAQRPANGFRAFQRLLLALVAIGLTSQAGCVTPQRCVSTTLKYMEAKEAYKCHGQCNLPCEQERHFEMGWRKGYLAVAEGRTGCPPAVPPTGYLSYTNEDCEGRAKAALWYQGYQLGAGHALQQRRNLFHRSPASATCRCEGCEYGTGSEGVLPPVEIASANQLGTVATTYRSPYVAPVAAPAFVPGPAVQKKNAETLPKVKANK